MKNTIANLHVLSKGETQRLLIFLIIQNPGLLRIDCTNENRYAFPLNIDSVRPTEPIAVSLLLRHVGRYFTTAGVPEVNKLVKLQDAVVVGVVMLHQRLDLAVRELVISQYVSRFVERDLIVSVCVHLLEDVLQF